MWQCGNVHREMQNDNNSQLWEITVIEFTKTICIFTISLNQKTSSTTTSKPRNTLLYFFIHWWKPKDLWRLNNHYPADHWKRPHSYKKGNCKWQGCVVLEPSASEAIDSKLYVFVSCVHCGIPREFPCTLRTYCISSNSTYMVIFGLRTWLQGRPKLIVG